MTVTELVNKSYLLATGQKKTLTSSDNEWDKLLAIANIYLLSWANEPDVDWASLYDTGVDIGTITATDTFDLDDTIRVISNDAGDYIRVQDSTDSDKYYNFDLVAAKQLKLYPSTRVCARVGSQLKFNKAFTSSDNEFGGTLLVPAYTTPDPLANAADEVPVDDPNWLVYMTAGEWVRNDITLAQNYPGLIQLSNQSMVAMKEANNPQTTTVHKERAMPRPTRW